MSDRDRDVAVESSRARYDPRASRSALTGLGAPSVQHVEDLLRGDAELMHLQDQDRPDRRVAGDRQEAQDVLRTAETQQRDGGIPRPTVLDGGVIPGGHPIPSDQCLPGGLHDRLAVPRRGREHRRELRGFGLQQQIGEQGGIRVAGEHEGRVHVLGGRRGRAEEPLEEVRLQLICRGT